MLPNITPKYFKAYLKYIFGFVLALCVLKSEAQFYNGAQMDFGKNRIQYQNFLWTYYRLERMDTYFYQEGKELAQYSATYAMKELEKMEKRLNYRLEEKIQFILFNNYSDLKQTNIGLKNNEVYNTGGMTYILGNRVLLYFDGNHENLERQIREGIAQMIFNQMIYGSSIGAQIKNQAIHFIPEWYQKGLVAYLAEPWSPELDEELRNLIFNKEVKKFNHLLTDHAQLAGHSMWHFIEQTYGENSFNALLQMSRLNHGIELSFMYSIGIGTKELYKQWYSYYEIIYKNEVADAIQGEIIPLKYRKNRVITGISKQPQGNLIAYTTNELGQSSLFIYDPIKKRNRRRYKKGFRLNAFQDLSYPVMAWNPSGKVLAFIVEDKGLVFLNLYNPSTRKTEQRNMHQFSKIAQFAYHPNGRYIIISGIRNGQSDLFQYDLAASSYQQLTHDVYDDLYPTYDLDGSFIYFSSNRPHDSLSPQNKAQKALSHLQIYAYPINNQDKKLLSISKQAFGSCTYPRVIDKHQIYYLSNQSGRNNLYFAQVDSLISHIDTTIHYRYQSRSFATSNWNQGAHFLNTSAADQRIYLLSKIKKLDQAYTINYTELPKTSVLPSITNLARTKRPHYHSNGQGKQNQNTPEQPKQHRRRFHLAQSISNSKSKEESPQTSQSGKAHFRATDKERNINNLGQSSPNSQPIDTFSFPKRRNYYVEFFVNKVTARLDYSYLNTNYQPYSGGKNSFFFGPDGQNSQNNAPIYLNGGYNGFFELGISDLMEDYRLSGGVKLSPTLSNNEYIASFNNLKNRRDYQLTFHRQIYENPGDYNVLKTFSHEIILESSYPFNEAFSWRSSLAYRNQTGIYLALNDRSLTQPKLIQNWGILRQALVFDATRSLGKNLLEGTRFKLFGEYYQQAEAISSNLFILGFDFRKYIRIHRSFIWANRIAGSTSFGHHKLLYYMGGVDGWLGAEFNDQTPIDYRENWAFQTLATNMRGFKQNIRNGNNFLLINSELRFPIIKYLFNRPLRNEFLNNFQIVGFGDLGTAWTGWDPFSKENALYTYYIHNGPIRVRVETDRDPLVGGFGTGVRSQLLGYFIRADLAWGVEDLHILSPQFYVSFSLDF